MGNKPNQVFRHFAAKISDGKDMYDAWFIVVLVLRIILFTVARMMKSPNPTLGTNIFLFFLSSNKDQEFLLQQGGSNQLPTKLGQLEISFPFVSNNSRISIITYFANCQIYCPDCHYELTKNGHFVWECS